MRILVTGSLNPWDLGASYERAFRELGHEVELFGWYERQERWSKRAPNKLSSVAFVASARRVSAVDLVLLAQRFKPQLVVLLKTDDLPLGGVGAVRAAAPGCRVVAFHPDDPFNVHRFRGPSHPRARYQLRSVDRYFIWSDYLVDRVIRAGARAAHYLGFASDPFVSHPVSTAESDETRFGADVSFAGNWDPKRERWLAPLARAGGLSLAIWGGPDWKHRSKDDAVVRAWRGEAPRGEDLAKAVVCAKASINVLRAQNETAENMRTYEIPACGGLMLAERSAQQERIFRDGVEAVYVDSPDDLVRKARALVRGSNDMRAGIRLAATRRASAHTYRARAQMLLDTTFGADRDNG